MEKALEKGYKIEKIYEATPTYGKGMWENLSK